MDKQSKKTPVIDYEGSDYQTSFWEEGGRAYEDRCEQIALKRLFFDQGDLLLEIGAGAGRNTPRYKGFQRTVLLDYSLTQLQQAQGFLGKSDKYIYVAGDVYRLPFVKNLFSGGTMIRTLHHMQDPLSALNQIHRVLKQDSPFLLEYANKQNLKAILRYIFGKQDWNPFSLEAVEFTELNFDFHPRSIRGWLAEAGFHLERQLTASHFGSIFSNELCQLVYWFSLTQFFSTQGHYGNFHPVCLHEILPLRTLLILRVVFSNVLPAVTLFQNKKLAQLSCSASHAIRLIQSWTESTISGIKNRTGSQIALLSGLKSSSWQSQTSLSRDVEFLIRFKALGEKKTSIQVDFRR